MAAFRECGHLVVATMDGWEARQGRGQHHSSKAIRRREGQKGSSAHTSDGADARSTRSAIDGSSLLS
ncbi:MAG: hypothetical protein K0U80_02065 [Actinomycetia bacterium]|nr:hypothetical protein [Actinomycetes bacterium]